MIGQIVILFYLCGQPAQQQGRRMPERILDRPLLTLISRVSARLPEVTQQIHSLRAKGVMLSHKAATFLSALIALPKSAGSLCI